MRKHETAVCGTARTVVWEVGKCENRRQMPFMISIYLLPDFERRTNGVQTRFKLCGIRLHEHHIFVTCIIVHMRIELETLTTFKRIAERFILA